MASISKDTPLSEITLRKYEKPSDLSERGLVRKLCLSIGLLQPGDSRDVVVDVLLTILKIKKELSSEQIKDNVIKYRKKNNLPLLGIASSNIRRQIKRLRNLYLIEKIANNYRITENSTLTETFEEKLENFALQSTLARIKDYLKEIQEKI